MSSQVQICNIALSSYLGKKTINSINDPTPEAEQCALNYDAVIDGLLERQDWTFCGKRQVLAEMINDRPQEWAFKYSIPNNMKSLIWVNRADVARSNIQMGFAPSAAYELSGEAIYTDVDNAVAAFTGDAPEVPRWPQYFQDAVSASLAARIAMPLTQDFKRARAAQGTAADLIENAIVEDANRQPPVDTREPASYHTARGA